MKKNIYVVASCTAVTVICKASSKEDAVRIAKARWDEQGYDFDQRWSPYLADEYFEEEDGSDALIFPD